MIEVGNYVIATPSELGNYKIADNRGTVISHHTNKINGCDLDDRTAVDVLPVQTFATRRALLLFFWMGG